MGTGIRSTLPCVRRKRCGCSICLRCRRSEKLLDGKLVTRFGQELGELGTNVRRALALPIKGEGIGQWGFFLTYDDKTAPYSQEEITFVRCVVDILALALLRLRHNTTLETVLRNAITKSKCLLK